VTAASFKYAIDRAANHDLASPAAQFITDPTGTGVDIDGALTVNEGNGTDVSGARARGNKLIINLTRATGRLISVLAMPFFQATSAKLPLDREVVDVRRMDDLPTAGPYTFALNDANRLTELRRNPYWKRGPGRTAPRNLDGVDLSWNLDEQVAFEMVKANQLDEGPLPSAEVQGVANQYGVNKTRFWVKPVSCLGWIPLNNRRGLFQDNAPMRRAVNWAIDRTDYLSNAAPYAMTPWTHFIPSGFPGSITKKSLQPYGARANIATARRIAAGHYRDGQVVLAYRSVTASNRVRAEGIRRDLTLLGLTVTMAPYIDFPKGNDWDLDVGYGFCMDGVDPADFLLDIWRYHAPWWPVSTKYDVKVRNANRLIGQARVRALGRLDVEIMKNLAPSIVTNTYNNRYFFSNRVDPKSLKYHAFYSDWSIPALALK
jgi:ABC-type oligopeptide transport system substrate-binding subunit